MLCSCKNKFECEHEDIKPIIYGYSKATIEVLLKNLFDSEIGFWKIANLDTLTLLGPRFWNDWRAYWNANNIFPLITVAAKEIDKLNFGNDWNTKDGTCARLYSCNGFS